MDNLIELIRKISYSEESYLIYVITKDKYQKILGKHFNIIDQHIEHLKIFAEQVEQCNPEYVIKLIKAIHHILLFSSSTQNNMRLFEIISRIHKELNNETFIKLFNEDAHIYYDIIYHLNKYNINISDHIESIHKYLIKRYEEVDIDNMPIDDIKPYGEEYSFIHELDKDSKYTEYRKLLCNHKIKRNILPKEKVSEIYEYIASKEKEVNDIIDERINIYREKIRKERENNKKIGNLYNFSNIINECNEEFINKFVKCSH